ncbi:hypothetical protein GCM10009736_70850 [Actinomadura bangladeshensis]
MAEYRLAKTANRSVVGLMSEFTYLAEVHRSGESGPDLLDLPRIWRPLRAPFTQGTCAPTANWRPAADHPPFGTVIRPGPQPVTREPVRLRLPWTWSLSRVELPGG